MIKVDGLNNRSLFNVSLKNKYNINLNINYKIGNIVHSFSHYRMNISFYNCEIKNSKFYSNSDTNYIKWITRKEINNYAFHKANHKLFDLLEKNNV
jgi:adenine-specific DNA glycosylase